MKKRFVSVLVAACLLGVLVPGRAAASGSLSATKALKALRVPQEVIVRFEGGTDASSKASARVEVDAEGHTRLGVPGAELLELDGTSVADAVAELEARPDVLYAEPNYLITASATPNDRFFSNQWALHDSGDVDIDAPEAWERATGTDNVTVAIVDSGVAWDHPDLAGNIWMNPGESGSKAANGVDDDGNGFVDDVRGWDWADGDNDPMDVSGHGTHVAGTIGARGNDGTGVAGVGWNMKLMPLRVLGASGSGSTADAAKAFDYAAAAGARVVNASIGGSAYSRVMADAISSHPETLFVVAAGNEAANNEVTPEYPCNLTFANVICVAALGRRNTLASYSNTGTVSVDLAAPGNAILSTVPHQEELFSEEFESDVASRWATGGTSAWGPEPGEFGTAYADSPGAFYASNADSWLALTQPIDVSNANGCAISYSAKMDVNWPHSFAIESSLDGTTWATKGIYYRPTNGWTTATDDLGSYLGSSLYLRFRLRSDGSGTNDGVAIDDVVVTCSMRTYSSDDYANSSGTSMAAPYVAGAAGVLFSAAPTSTVAAVRSALLAGVDPLPSSTGLTVTGGRLNLATSLGLIAPALAPTPQPTPTLVPDTIEHDRAVSLKLVRGPRLKGRIEVTDGFSACASGARVVIRRNGSFLRKVTADTVGSFIVRVPSYRGRYTAKVSSSDSGAGHVCSATTASTVR